MLTSTLHTPHLQVSESLTGFCSTAMQGKTTSLALHPQKLKLCLCIWSASHNSSFDSSLLIFPDTTTLLSWVATADQAPKQLCNSELTAEWARWETAGGGALPPTGCCCGVSSEAVPSSLLHRKHLLQCSISFFFQDSWKCWQWFHCGIHMFSECHSPILQPHSFTPLIPIHVSDHFF